jgi:hypothetical protein
MTPPPNDSVDVTDILGRFEESVKCLLKNDIHLLDLMNSVRL